ncbi:MAG: hypothetical protein WC641_03425 [Patescibacteria group bacterium]
MSEKEESPKELWEKRLQEVLKAVEGQTFSTPYGVKDHYDVGFTNLELNTEKGPIVLNPPPNMRLLMSNIPSAEQDGLPRLLSTKELCSYWLAIDPDSQAQVSQLGPDEQARLAQFRKPILEYEAQVQIAIGKQDFLCAEEVLGDDPLRLLPRFVLEHIKRGMMDFVVPNPRNPRTAGRYMQRKVSITRLRRILSERMTAREDGKNRPERYEVTWFEQGKAFEHFGFMIEMLHPATGQGCITHMVYGRKPCPDAEPIAPDATSSRLGDRGRGFLMFIEHRDIVHAMLSNHMNLLPDDGQVQTHPSMHSIWLPGHPTAPDHAKFRFRESRDSRQQRRARQAPEAPKPEATPRNGGAQQATQPAAPPPPVN